MTLHVRWPKSCTWTHNRDYSQQQSASLEYKTLHSSNWLCSELRVGSAGTLKNVRMTFVSGIKEHKKPNELQQCISVFQLTFGQAWCYPARLCVQSDHVNISHVVTGTSLHVGVLSIPSAILSAAEWYTPGSGWDKSQGEQTAVKWSIRPSLPSIFHGFFILESFIAMPSRPSTPTFLIKI